jgi:hypothetical protein
MLGRTEESVAELKRVVQMKEDFAPAHHALGLGYVALGATTRAATHLRQFLQLTEDPEDKASREAQQLLARITADRTAQGLRFERYSNKEHGFGCQYPAGWKLLRGADVTAVLPDMAEARSVVAALADPTLPQCNLVIQVSPIEADALSDQDIAEALEALDGVYKARLKGFQKVEAAAANVGDVKGIRYVLKCERAGVTVQQCVVTLVKARKALTVTFTCLERDYAKLEPSFKEVLASFTFDER